MKTIDIGGKERPFRFSLYAIQAYCEMKNISFTEFASKANQIITGKDIDGLIDVLYAGLMGGAHREKIPCDFTREQVGDWVDDAGFQAIPVIIKAFTESIMDKKKETVNPKAKK